MSELASIPEQIIQEAKPRTTCPVCSFDAGNIKKLKTHILLKHPKVNLCLFCVEKKGWSDTFATQSSYNQHYKENHEGIIENKEKIRQEDKQWKRDERTRINELAKKLGKPPPKRLRKRYLCSICEPRKEFESPDSYESHMISDHDYDYCQICSVIGPISSIRVHILENHSNHDTKTSENSETESSKKFCCYICCGSGPIFKEASKLSNHLVLKHDLKSSLTSISHVIEFLCFNCDTERRTQGFPSTLALVEHLKFKHDPSEKHVIKNMQKRHKTNTYNFCDPDIDDLVNSKEPSFLPPPQKLLPGIKNTSGQDCFSISTLHLLAQTDVGRDLRPLNEHLECTVGSCLISNFMSEYVEGKKTQLDPNGIVQNYSAFGLQAIHDVDCGDFLRGVLYELGEDKTHHPNQTKEKCFIWLEWKFECPGCQRFLAMQVKDYVLKLNVPEEKSLEKLLEDYLHNKKCAACGKQCEVKPGVKKLGPYLFLEIDRSILLNEEAKDETSKEIRLFSLKLQPTYDLLGSQYGCLGTINYKLDSEEGGHYVTNLFPSSNECLKVHELEAKCSWKKPDFDTETVIVVLKRIDVLDSVNYEASTSSGISIEHPLREIGT